ncbi:MAG TPA: biopolymer transporter ExbD [Candidatus Margulisiibacteriota bacterium]|nr:biopolymer transporter ExbD [Candidatus Margulisiibacteriota bacterium]
MRFKGRLELEHGLRQIDIAPLINIVFLLLMFFMLTSSFIAQPGIAVNLPRAVTSEAVSLKNVEISVTAENATYLNGKAVTNQELSRLLKGLGKRGQPILIKSDRKVSLGKVVEIWDLARDSGIREINIATNQE